MQEAGKYHRSTEAKFESALFKTHLLSIIKWKKMCPTAYEIFIMRYSCLLDSDPNTLFSKIERYWGRLALAYAPTYT